MKVTSYIWSSNSDYRLAQGMKSYSSQQLPNLSRQSPASRSHPLSIRRNIRASLNRTFPIQFQLSIIQHNFLPPYSRQNRVQQFTMSTMPYPYSSVTQMLNKMNVMNLAPTEYIRNFDRTPYLVTNRTSYLGTNRLFMYVNEAE